MPNMPSPPPEYRDPWAVLSVAQDNVAIDVKIFPDEALEIGKALGHLMKVFGAMSNYALPGIRDVGLFTHIVNTKIIPCHTNQVPVKLTDVEYNNILDNVDIMLDYCMRHHGISGQE